MKTRNGFVSNSSSSSFMIAIKKPEPCSSCGHTPVDFLKALEIRIGDKKKDYEFFNRNVQEYIEEQKCELEELKKDREWILKERKVYEELLKDEKLAEGILAFNRLKKELDEERRGFKRNFRDNRWLNEDNPSVLDIVKNWIRGTTTSYVDEKIKEKTKIIKKLEMLNLDGKWTLFNFKIDKMVSGTMEKAIDLLLESKQAKLIKKETT